MRTVIDYKLLGLRFAGWFFITFLIFSILLPKNPSGLLSFVALVCSFGVGGWTGYNSIVRITPEKVSWGSIFGILPKNIATNKIESYSIEKSTKVHDYQSGGKTMFSIKKRYIVDLIGQFGAEKVVFTSYNSATRLVSHIQGVIQF